MKYPEDMQEKRNSDDARYGISSKYNGLFKDVKTWIDEFFILAMMLIFLSPGSPELIYREDKIDGRYINNKSIDEKKRDFH